MRYLLIVALSSLACNAPLDAPEGAPGPQGERGPRGAPGPACAPPTTYVVTASGPAGSVVALCDEGDALTGGHCQPTPGVDLVQSGPLDELDGMNGWWCYGSSSEPIGPMDVHKVFAYAICLER